LQAVRVGDHAEHGFLPEERAMKVQEVILRAMAKKILRLLLSWFKELQGMEK